MQLFKDASFSLKPYTLATGEKVYPAVVDVKRGLQSGGDISYVKTDSNVGFIVVTFVNGDSKFDIPSTANVICSIQRPDGHYFELDCEKLDESAVQVALGTAGTKVEGSHSFDFKIIYSEDVVIGTPIMSYAVQNGLTIDDAIEQDERLPRLTALISEVEEIHQNTTKLAKDVETLSENVNTIVENASTRLEEELAEFRAESAELINNSNIAVEGVNNALGQIDTLIGEVNQVVGEANDVILETNNVILEVNTTLDTVNNKIFEIEGVVSEANQVIETMGELQNTTLDINQQSEVLIGEMQELVEAGLDNKEVVDARDGETSLSARLFRDLYGRDNLLKTTVLEQEMQVMYRYIDNAKVDLSPMENQIERIDAKVGTNTNNINANRLNIISNTNAINLNAEGIATNQANIATNTVNIATNRANIANIANKVDAYKLLIDSNTTNIEELESTVTSNTALINNNKADITGLTNTVNSYVSQVSDIRTELTGLEGTVAGFTSDIESNTANIIATRGEISTKVNSAKSELYSAISGVEGEISTVSQRLTNATVSLEGEIGAVGTELDTLSMDVSRLEREMSTLDEKVINQGNNVANVVQSMQRIHYSTSEPTASDGKDGDLWVIYGVSALSEQAITLDETDFEVTDEHETMVIPD